DPRVAEALRPERRAGDGIPLIPRRDRPAVGLRVGEQAKAAQIGEDRDGAAGPVLHLPDIGDLVQVVVDVVGSAGEGGGGERSEEEGHNECSHRSRSHGTTPVTLRCCGLVGTQLGPSSVFHMRHRATQSFWIALRTSVRKSSGLTAPSVVFTVRLSCLDAMPVARLTCWKTPPLPRSLMACAP